jgi:DNA-binding transcriptional regulator LsrR (DeoR family)
MADNATHGVVTLGMTRGNIIISSEHTCVQCIELERQLKETVNELKSARLIIDDPNPAITSKNYKTILMPFNTGSPYGD